MTSPTAEERQFLKDDGIDLLEVTRVLLVRRITILICVLVPAIITAVLVLIMKPTYTADATFLPPSSTSSGSSMLLGELGMLSGAGSSLGGVKDPGEVYIGILGSRSVADDLITRFDLANVYHTKRLSQTERALAAHSKFLPGKDTIITVTVTDQSPRRAADMANAYLAALRKQNDRLALTEAAQRREFFDEQLRKEKDQLADAEVDLARTQEQTGLIRPTGQAELQITTIAQTQAAISNREIQLTALLRSSTEQNPDVIRLRAEIDELRKQLADLENSNGKVPPGGIQVPTSKVPELTLIYVRKEREVKYHEDLYALLLRQFESAKLDESRSAPLIQVLDTAVVPDTKSGPPRTILTVIAALSGAFIAVVWIILRSKFERMMRNPERAAKVREIQRAARLSRGL